MSLIGDRKDHAVRSNGRSDFEEPPEEMADRMSMAGSRSIDFLEQFEALSFRNNDRISSPCSSPHSRLLMHYLGVSSTDWQQR
jgi:hypothetical protein